MKKFSAILLIALFIFNLFGYRFVLNYMQQQADSRLEASLDKNQYDESELITIKIPISIPYQNNWKDFERIDGEVTVEGKIFKYVKRKIYNDSLVLLCLPDHDKMKIESAKTEFFKYSNDIAQNSSKKQGNSKAGWLKNMLGEYTASNSTYSGFTAQIRIKHSGSMNVNSFPSSPHISPEEPPEFA